MKKKKLKTRKKVPIGRTLSTHDNFLANSKTGSKKTRPLVVLDSNKWGELMTVILSSKKGPNRTNLTNYQDGRSYFKHYIETKDNEGNPITVGDKFKENHKNMDVPTKQVNKIIDTLLNHCKQKQRNLKLYNEFKSKKND